MNIKHTALWLQGESVFFEKSDYIDKNEDT